MDNAVGIVQTYLRINGYFTVSEYPIIEQSRSGNYRSATDIDILAVRFPQARRQIPHSHHRNDTDNTSFVLDKKLGLSHDHTDMIIGEVKEGRAEINRGARNSEILECALTRFGCCHHGESRGVVTELLRNGHAITHSGHRVRMMAFGAGTTDASSLPWETMSLLHVIDFIRRYLRDNWEVFRHAQFKDPALAFLALCEKVGAGTIAT